jgi:Predicted membrane protein
MTLFSSIYRVAVASARGYQEDDCSSKASALTFYTLLSIVPVLAVAFGIAKGFGFEKHLESELSHKFMEQREVVDKLIDFAYKTLQNTQSGLIAGIGLVVLFWTVLKLFGSIENSFNSIWKVKKSRTLARSFSDYLAMMLFCPIFFAASSSLSVFITTQIVTYSQENGFWETVSPVFYMAFHIFPLILAWLLFTALYSIMPNTKVPLKYAFIAGICAGTAYQIVQAIYIKFQIGLSSYGAIYGSFAALPLFLVWINTSWLIALAGAEIAYHAENDKVHAALSKSSNQRLTDARVLGLILMQSCIKAFCEGAKPPSVYSLAEQTGAPVTVVRELIHQLNADRLLMEVNWMGSGGEFYFPGRDVKSITLKAVCDALDNARHEKYTLVSNGDVEIYEEALASIDTFVENSSLNSPINQLIRISKPEPT